MFLSVLAQIDSLDQLSLSRPVQIRDLLRLSERDQAFGWFGAVGAVRVVFGVRFHRPLELALVLPDQEFSTLVNPGWDVGPDAASAGITADMIRLAPSPRVARKALSRIAQGRRIINPDALNERDEDIRLDLPTPLNVCNTSGDEHAWDNEVSLGKERSAFRDAARVLAHEKELVARHIHRAADTGYPFDPEAYLLDRQGNITVLGEPQHIAIGLCSQAADYYLGPFSRGVIRKFGQQYPQYRVNDELPCGGLDKALEANLIHQPRQWLVKVDSLQWVGFSGSSYIYPKEELEQLAESLGLIVADGPGVGIGIVFTSDLSSQSRKVKRAWDEGILIAEYAEFVRLAMSKTTEIEAIMNPRYDMY